MSVDGGSHRCRPFADPHRIRRTQRKLRLTTTLSDAVFADDDIANSEHGEEPSRGRHFSAVSPTPSMANTEDTIYELFRSTEHDLFDVVKFLKALRDTGLRYDTDPRLAEMRQLLQQMEHSSPPWEGSVDIFEFRHLFLDREQFKRAVMPCCALITKALQNQFVIPDWQEFLKNIKAMFQKVHDDTNQSGKIVWLNGEAAVASYIPQLGRVDPKLYGVAVCTVDGQRLSLGDCKVPFCLQSVSKAFSYAIALNDVGADIVHESIGTEPSGRTFNEICLDAKNRPHNPMINAGAIVVASILLQGQQLSDRFDFMMSQFRKLAGGEHVGFNNSVFLSERKSADRNFALAYYMREHNVFPEKVDIQEIMDFYFQLCSIETNADGLAVMGATLANGGINPITCERLLSNQSCRDTLSLMYSCGMYDYSGMFAFKVGLPAKSGVSGAMVLVVPNVAAFAIFSPPLDPLGNTVRGVAFCQALVEKFNFHNYDNILHSESRKIDPRRSFVETQGDQLIHVLFAAKSGDLNAIKRYILQGMDLNQPDYDGRTALHLAASEGHTHVIKFLVDKWNISPFQMDRWGHTALDDAVQFNHSDCVKLLERAMERKQKEKEIAASD